MMFPSPKLECLKVGHAKFGFGVLQTAFDKIALAAAESEGREAGRVQSQKGFSAVS